jgi:drug/metabolite transporter (DMT)-like permease
MGPAGDQGAVDHEVSAVDGAGRPAWPWSPGGLVQKLQRRLPPGAVGWSALFVVYVVWGSTYLAIRVADESIPPFVMAGVRYFVAAVLMAPVVLRSPRGTRLDASSSRWRQVGSCAIVGVLLLAGGNGGVSWAERTVPSGVAALLVASVPLWMIIIDFLINRVRPTRRSSMGILLGFVGVAILARPSGHAGIAGLLAVLGASVSWATGSMLSRRLTLPGRAFVATALQMMAGAVVLALLAVVTNEWAHFHPSTVSVRSWVALAYLIVPGAILALSCYTVALARLPTSIVSTYAYVNPVVAVALGTLLLSEHLTAPVLLGGGLIVAAVVITVTGRKLTAQDTG